jgi:hypothetical protein
MKGLPGVEVDFGLIKVGVAPHPPRALLQEGKHYAVARGLFDDCAWLCPTADFGKRDTRAAGYRPMGVD